MGVPEATRATWDFRFALARLAGMTATLGAVVALPFTLVRVKLTAEQTATAADTLFNDKISAASKGLHAMRQRWDEDAKQNIWEADVGRRNAAIDRLEGLASKDPEEATRIARMLEIYIGQLSIEVPPLQAPDGLSPSQFWAWLKALRVNRTDVQSAATALSRLKKHKLPAGYSLSLRAANLQAFDIRSVAWAGAELIGANLQRAYLRGALLKGADLQGAHAQGARLFNATMTSAKLNHAQMHFAQLVKTELQNAHLIETNLQRAYLGGTQLQGARLGFAQLQGARLRSVLLDHHTGFSCAEFRGAACANIDFQDVELSQEQIQSFFADGSVVLPGGVTPSHPNWPSHFVKATLEPSDFDRAWRVFQQQIGFDPDDPSTW